MEICGYTDVDRASSPSYRRCTLGYRVLIGGNIISLKSKKQTIVVRSRAEAEYRAMMVGTCELMVKTVTLGV